MWLADDGVVALFDQEVRVFISTEIESAENMICISGRIHMGMQ